MQDDVAPAEEQATVRLKKGYRARVARIELAGPWRGFWIEANLNPKRKHYKLLSDNATVDKGLCTVITDHNIVDEDGNDLPKPLTEKAMDEIPEALTIALLRAYIEAHNDFADIPKR